MERDNKKMRNITMKNTTIITLFISLSLVSISILPISFGNEARSEDLDIISYTTTSHISIQITFPDADFTVDNSGDLDDAIDQFLNYVLDTVK